MRLNENAGLIVSYFIKTNRIIFHEKGTNTTKKRDLITFFTDKIPE